MRKRHLILVIALLVAAPLAGSESRVIIWRFTLSLITATRRTKHVNHRVGRIVWLPEECSRLQCLRAPALANVSASRQNNANLTLVQDSPLLESIRSVCQPRL
jgi:hypothetical protein